MKRIIKTEQIKSVVTVGANNRRSIFSEGVTISSKIRVNKQRISIL